MKQKITRKDFLDVLSKIEGFIITEDTDRKVSFTHNLYGGNGWAKFKDDDFEVGDLDPWEGADLFEGFAIDEVSEIYYILKAGLTAAKYKRKHNA